MIDKVMINKASNKKDIFLIPWKKINRILKKIYKKIKIESIFLNSKFTQTSILLYPTYKFAILILKTVNPELHLQGFKLLRAEASNPIESGILILILLAIFFMVYASLEYLEERDIKIKTDYLSNLNSISNWSSKKYSSRYGKNNIFDIKIDEIKAKLKSKIDDNHKGIIITGGWGTGKTSIFKAAFEKFKEGKRKECYKDLNFYIYDSYNEYSKDSKVFIPRIINNLYLSKYKLKWCFRVFKGLSPNNFQSNFNNTSGSNFSILSNLKQFLNVENNFSNHHFVEAVFQKYKDMKDCQKGTIYLIIDDLDRVTSFSEIRDILSFLNLLKKTGFIKTILLLNRRQLEHIVFKNELILDHKTYLNKNLDAGMSIIDIPYGHKVKQQVAYELIGEKLKNLSPKNNEVTTDITKIIFTRIVFSETKLDKLLSKYNDSILNLSDLEEIKDSSDKDLLIYMHTRIIEMFEIIFKAGWVRNDNQKEITRFDELMKLKKWDKIKASKVCEKNHKTHTHRYERNIYEEFEAYKFLEDFILEMFIYRPELTALLSIREIEKILENKIDVEYIKNLTKNKVKVKLIDIFNKCFKEKLDF